MSVDEAGNRHDRRGRFAGREQGESSAAVLEVDLGEGPLNGCAACGRDIREHGYVEDPASGEHRWIEPGQQLVDERIAARRAAQEVSGAPDPVLQPVCGPECWTPAVCPQHGGGMNPRGRSAGVYAYDCCDSRHDPKLNPRHLWNVHDEVRAICDPAGWSEHVASCEQCAPADTDQE